MIYILEDTSKVEELFADWKETLIYSCMQKIMGHIYVTDLDKPEAACAFVGCFALYAGKPEKELIMNKPKGFVIMVPQNQEWQKLIEETYPKANKVKRFAMKKNTIFSKAKIQYYTAMIPEGYTLHKIDSRLYDQCLENEHTIDFVSSFESKNQFLKLGRGRVILKGDRIVAGASSYSRYREGIEIEVDTIPEERRKHLATVACAALIGDCLQEGLYPSWDAQNMNSVHLAESLGYELDYEYTAYEVRD